MTKYSAVSTFHYTTCKHIDNANWALCWKYNKDDLNPVPVHLYLVHLSCLTGTGEVHVLASNETNAINQARLIYKLEKNLISEAMEKSIVAEAYQLPLYLAGWGDIKF